MHCTKTALTTITDDLFLGKSKDLYLVFTLLVLSVAFDPVNHSLLLETLHDLGFNLWFCPCLVVLLAFPVNISVWEIQTSLPMSLCAASEQRLQSLLSVAFYRGER